MHRLSAAIGTARNGSRGSSSTPVLGGIAGAALFQTVSRASATSLSWGTRDLSGFARPQHSWGV